MRIHLGPLMILVALAAGAAAGPNDRDRIVRALDHLRARGDLDGALVSASQARKRYPDDLSIHTRYQDIRRSLGQEAQVREEYRRRWRSNKSVESVCLYARLLDGKAAARQYRRALRMQPGYFWAHYGIGVVYMHAGDQHKALYHLEIAQSLEPRQPAPKIRLGQLSERSGDFEAALKSYQLASEVAPDVPDPLFHQAFALLALDRHREAREVGVRLQRHDAADAPALGSIALGVLANVRGDRADAVRHFEAAVERAGRFGHHALTFLGDTLSDLGRFVQAHGAYSGAIDKNPHSVRARMGLGYLLYRRGAFKEADAQFKSARTDAARGDPRNEAAPLFFRGVIAEEEGRLTNALHFYDMAIRRDGESPEYHLALAALYERTDQPRKAVKVYARAARLDPGDALSCLQAGLIEAELKRGKEARQHLEEAVKRDPTLLDAYLAAGSVCQDLLDLPKAARQWYRKYLAAGGKDERVVAWIEELEGK